MKDVMTCLSREVSRAREIAPRIDARSEAPSGVSLVTDCRNSGVPSGDVSGSELPGPSEDRAYDACGSVVGAVWDVASEVGSERDAWGSRGRCDAPWDGGSSAGEGKRGACVSASGESPGGRWSTGGVVAKVLYLRIPCKPVYASVVIGERALHRRA